MGNRAIFRTIALALLTAALAGAQTPAPTPNDYRDTKTWLCRPGGHDACDTDLTTTVIAADGTMKREAWAPDPKAAIDCFYVYPTVSTDATPISDMVPDEAERNVIRQQFARFASECRPYAPMYRQTTLAGLRTRLAGGAARPLDEGVSYDDVRDAWKYYLEHDNGGRGVVLIGHSQGSFILLRLIREEIDGQPVQKRMVSAILLGTTLPVPRGKDVGGVFQHIPLCHSASQTGCVIVYASFRSTVPPPANTLFGRVPDANMTAACTNPAALGGGSGELHSYLSAQGQLIVGTAPEPWVNTGASVDTPWVSLPGMLTARCATNENATYLEVTVHADSKDRRVHDIRGDLSFNGQVQTNWGLHLIDVNLSMGNLIDIVGAQIKSWLKSRQ